MTETQDASPEPDRRRPRDVLRRIVETKRRELDALRPRARELEARLADAPAPLDVPAHLDRGAEVALIAEVKRRSPGAGEIRPGLDPVALARGYAGAGASAISVLTDGPWFGGSLEDLGAVRAAVSVPLLRKDFTLDPLHVLEGRSAGADLILLIVRILEDTLLRDLIAMVQGLGMAALVEVHDEAELERALGAGARIVGINNRDLSTFTTDLETTLRLLERLPDDVLVVSESGIRTPGDVDRLGRGGVAAVLVGEALLRAEDPSARAAELVGRTRAPRGPS